MFLKFRTTGSFQYIDQLLDKLNLEVEIKQDAKNDCIYPSVRDKGTVVANAVSCWIQFNLKKNGYMVENVRTSELITSSWGKNQDEMLFSSDPELEEPVSIEEAEKKIWDAVEQDKKNKEERKRELDEYIRKCEEDKQREKERKEARINEQRKLYSLALEKVKYRKEEKLDINGSWFLTNLRYATDTEEGSRIFAPDWKGRYFEKFMAGKYILCQATENEDIFFIKVSRDIYIFGRVDGNSFWRGSYIISKENLFDGRRLNDIGKLSEVGQKELLELCETIREYDTLGLVMNAGSYDGIFSGIFWGVRLNLHGDLERQWSELARR